MEKLKGQRVRNTTKRNYYSVWKSFNDFFIRLDIKPEFWEDRLTLFIGYLINFKQLQSQTVRSYISAIRNVLQDDGYEINENKFLLSSLVKVCKYQNDQVRTRLPIQKPMLIELVNFTESFYQQQGQPYLATLFRTLFITTYFGLFRVSEITLTPGGHAVQVTDVRIGSNKRKFLSILRSSKTHGKYSHPQLIKITTSRSGNENRRPLYCPYEALQKYIAIRLKYKSPNEPFFVFRDYSPVTGTHMRSTLHLMLQLMNYDQTLYNCTSFRIGRSCDLLKYGVTIENIKKLGRWKSNVVYTYLRLCY